VNGPSSYPKLQRLRLARRVWAVASVRGEAHRLVRLHDRIGERFDEGDRLVYLGNYLGGGAAIIATLDELLDFRRRVIARARGFACDVAFLRGTQEEMWQKLLQLQFAPNPGQVLEWLVRAGVEATVRAYGGDLRRGFAATRDGPRTITRWTASLRAAMNREPGHTTLFSALRHAAFTEEGGLLFVHAAVDPSRSLAAQGDAFWWGQEDVLDLKSPFAGYRRVVRGVDRERRGLVERDFALSLDGGAGEGGPLLAACLGKDGSVLELLEA
jgi:hypothetical protein